MILKNLNFSVRHLVKQKTNSLIHITGLTLGISVCLLIGLFIRHHTRFDSFHQKASAIYRVNSVFSEAGINFDLYATPIPLADAIRNAVAGVEKVTLTRALFKTVVEVTPQRIFKQEHVLVIEADYLEIFNVQVLQGNGPQAMRKPYQALITESTAKKFYGDADPLGQTFNWKGKYNITVAGVIQDPPSNTHLPVSMLLSYVDDEEFLGNGDTWYFGGFPWVKIQASTYVLLDEQADPEKVLNQLKALADVNINSNPLLNEKIHATFEIQPLAQIHMDANRFGGGPWVAAINPMWLGFFGCIGVVVLLLATVNFLNLSTATALSRAKEIGIRKSIGARKNELIGQFLLEVFLLVAVSTGLSLLLTSVGIDLLSNTMDQNIEWRELLSVQVAGVLSIGVLFTTLLAGLYPAWVIAKFNPIVTLKANAGVPVGKSGVSWLRKGLVSLQFSISAMLVVAVIVLARQVEFMYNKDLGFRKDNIMNVEIPDVSKAKALGEELQQIAGVDDVSLSRSSPISNDHWWNSISETEKSETRHSVCAIYGDGDFLAFYELKLLSGRVPQANEFVPDSLRTDNSIYKVVVNEELLKKLQLGSPAEAIGKHFWWGGPAEITGVISDFNSEPLKFGITPTVIAQNPELYSQANIKLAPGKGHSETMQSVEAMWKKHFPDGVFEANFLDSQVKGFYQLEDRVYKLFTVFATLAVAISCLGLWGLVVYATGQRTREIGIRKVMGASVENIVLLLSREFILLVAISFVVASPIAYFGLNELLHLVAYRVSIGWSVFAWTGFVLLLATLLTVGVRTTRTANANPVDSLKNE